MTPPADSFPYVRINFNGTKRYRRFPFLPRVGDRINLTEQDEGISFALDVDAIWFDDNYGEEACEVMMNCTSVEETKIGKIHQR